MDKKYHKAASATHYQANKEKVYAASIAARKRRQAVVDSLRAVPCKDCGGEFPVCAMDFHHRDPTQKLGGVAAMVHNCGLPRILEEIKKCDVICANCHRIRHQSPSDGTVDMLR